MSGNGSIRAHGEAPADKAQRYLNQEGSDGTLSKKQAARLGTTNFAEQLVSQHNEQQASNIVSPSRDPRRDLSLDVAIAFIKATKIEPGLYAFREDNLTTEQIRSKITRYLRLNGYPYSTTTSGGWLLVEIRPSGRS